LEQAERKKREQAAAEDAARRAAEAKAKQPQPLVDGSALGELTSPFWKKRPFQLGAAALSVAVVVAYMQQPVAVTPKPIAPITPPATAPAVAPAVAPSKKSEPKKLPFEPDMADIPAGEFTMGCDGKRDDVEGGCDSDEKPAHTVKVSGFKLAKTEVTFDQWDACEKAKACPHAQDQGWGRGNRPVINVSWDDITQKYLPWLNKETGKIYRLPTEAEWEYAARGGTDTAYPWGNKASHEFANYGKDECCGGLASGKDKWVNTSPVGSFAANPYGLHDMHGNVWEWVSDWHSGYAAEPQQDPKGPSSGVGRVLRGGSWFDGGRGCRSAYRFLHVPGHRFSSFGFRLALGH
jgi:formylglycine-generating enzyme required for sulfatase activity